MYEFEIMNNSTKETDIIFGYSIADAYRRSKLNMVDWTVLHCEYVD